MDVETKRRLRWFWLFRILLSTTFLTSSTVALGASYIYIGNYKQAEVKASKIVDANRNDFALSLLEQLRQNDVRNTKFVFPFNFLYSSAPIGLRVKPLYLISEISNSLLLLIFSNIRVDFDTPNMDTEEEWERKQQNFLFVIVFATTISLYSLLILLLQKNPVYIPLLGQLNCFLPEECVAEVGALKQLLESQQRNVWEIRFIILRELISITIAFLLILLNNVGKN